METFFCLMQANMYVNYVRELVISLYCFRIDYEMFMLLWEELKEGNNSLSFVLNLKLEETLGIAS